MKTKVCSKCGRELPVDIFALVGLRRASRCRDCLNEEQRLLKANKKQRQQRYGYSPIINDPNS